MAILKKILLGIAVLVAVLLIVGLLTKTDMAAEVEVVINKPVGEVFDYVKYLENQGNYSKWQMMDPNMKKDYTGTDGTVGFVSSWDSEVDDVGKGEQEIIAIREGERIDYELRFSEPWESVSTAYMTTTSLDSSQTKVIWGFSGSMPYPMNLMLLFTDMEGLVRDDLQTGLDMLKELLESKQMESKEAMKSDS